MFFSQNLLLLYIGLIIGLSVNRLGDNLNTNYKEDTMNITDVRVRKMMKESNLKAVASITIDDDFVVHDIKVVEGEKGLFIAMPSRKAADGEYRDIAHPINSATRSNIQEIVLDAYEKVLMEEPAPAEAPAAEEAPVEEAPAEEAPAEDAE